MPRKILALLAITTLLLPISAAAQEAPPATREASREAVEQFRPVIAVVENSRNLATTPETIGELIDLEGRIRNVVEKVIPATVGLTIGQGQGSGVIISPDGYVLTAAHVAGRPGSRVTVIMPDGTRYRGVSLGINRSLDDGLVKITDPRIGNLPWAPVGSADDLPLGTWTVALGHPGGYQRERPPVVRVGRILAKGEEFVLTDNTLVGGDSGGPLFDLDGRVIGIHSRIEGNIVRNVHVPSDRFLDDWDRLVGSEAFGGDVVPQWLRNGPAADDGLRFDARETDDEAGGARVLRVLPRSPAARAGIRPNDRIVAIDGRPVGNGQEAILRSMGLREGREVTYSVKRGQEMLEFRVTPIDPNDLRRSEQRQNYDRPVMGIMLDLNYPGPGVRIDGVREEGPAAAAGLEGGDIIVSYNGQYLRNASDMSALQVDAQVGDQIEIEVEREGQRLTLSLTLGRFRDVYPERMPSRD